MKIIAHRGWSSRAPENTEVAINKAIELGVDMVEIDIRRTADNQIVVFHDSRLKRLTGSPGMVRNRTLAELQQLECGSWFDESYRGERILTFSQALEIMRGRTKVMVEIKIDKRDRFDQCVPQMLSTISDQGMDEQVCLQSFNSNILKGIHHTKPNMELHKLIVFNIPLSPFYFDEKISTGKVFREEFYRAINIDYRYVTIPLLNYLRKHNKEIYSWTANKVRPMNRLVKMGVDGIITNYPSKLKTLLELR